MGYNTTIMFLNDCADQILKNPEQVARNIYDAMGNMNSREKTYSVGYCGNPMQAMKTEHADVVRVYVSYGNCLQEVGGYPKEENLELRKTTLKRAKEIIKWEEQEIKKIEKSKQLDTKNNR